MPSSYAHYYFGERVAASLGGAAGEAVKNYKELFYIGLHGPDILFYYKPLKKNEINCLGYAMHDRPASEFFKRAADIWRSSDIKQAQAAYLTGFICHYCLDHACHGYIEKKMAVSSLAHAEVENEFDRFLIIKSGKEVKKCNLTAHINATQANAEVVAPFFENVTPEEAVSSLKSMKFYNSVLIGNRAYKRLLVNICLKLSGKYDKLKSAMMYKHPIAACEDSNKRLYKLLVGAEADCIRLINSYYGFLEGRAELDSGFDFTFGAGDNWQDIPVLPPQEEDEYTV